ncbi:hypothetical protein AAFF_G00169360 [Aldrovandia affinis]|uniref:VWFD domain-containing protein n=1 Tax=Aldrovandia affinis TaxID=143900 RepID=A0AAD7RP88_9TELE|nr:hypothetical protein AAFF_G00169360 [Aldrovandia affinis]
MIQTSAPLILKGPTTIKVSVPLLGFVQERTVNPGEGVTFQLPTGVEMIGSGKSGKTVRIEATQDIMVMSLNYKPKTADTSVIYPVTNWGTEYYIYTPFSSPVGTYKEFAITNHERRNSIKVYLKSNIMFEGKFFRAGSEIPIELGPFETVQIQNVNDLTGSRVVSNLPVAVSTGHSCTWKFSKCNHVYEQLLPVNSWGTSFFVAPLDYQIPKVRYDSIIIQASQRTLVTVQEGDSSKTVTMNRGDTVEYKSRWPEAHHITADKGIQVLFEFNGVIVENRDIYDPFLMTILPTDDFCMAYTLEGQADFTNMAIMVARTKDLTGLTFDKTPVPKNLKWRTVAGGEYSWTEIRYAKGEGLHRVAHPSSPFGLYSIGTAQQNGYGSPALCNPVPKSYATCLATGDPHYTTFDGRGYNFHGTCVYQLAGVCSQTKGLEPFDILVQNHLLKNGVGSKLVEIKVYGITIVLTRQYDKTVVMINNERTNLPAKLLEKKVDVYNNQLYAVIKTDFGLKVSFDWKSTVTVDVPITYEGAMCGLCGNYNKKPQDDMKMKDGKEATNPKELGQSWRVAEIPGCIDGCRGGKCPDCDMTELKQYEADNYCGLLRNTTNETFGKCQSQWNSYDLYHDCLYDVCLYKGEQGSQCHILAAYTHICQGLGIQVGEWRNSTNCSYTCFKNSHYELCGDGCPATCATLAPPADCNSTCKEGCVCNKGYILSGDQCVPFAKCGCTKGGRYYKLGEVFYPNEKCEEECTCTMNGMVECKKFSCGPNEMCAVKNNVRGCYPIGTGSCTISGDPHYRTFDNSTYTFQGNCTYTVAKSCNVEGTRLKPFSVVVENEKWTGVDASVSVAKLVAVEVYGNILILRRNQIGLIMVNGIMQHLPLNLNDGEVEVYRAGWYEVIKTNFGLRVAYDLVYKVVVTIPDNYGGKTCGLCGNFNNEAKDDFRLPDGSITKSVQTFGAAWKVAVPGVVCDNGCSGNVCPECDKDQKVTIERDCGIIAKANGPFAACLAVLSPASYISDCVYDVCVSKGDRHVLCNSIDAYVTDCQTAGVKIALTCPANSHYEICAETYKTPCPGLDGIIKYPDTCAEGCACNEGYLYNGTGCVEWEQCSCYQDGHTYEIGQRVITDDCKSLCVCQDNGKMKCEQMVCPSGSLCQVKDGVMNCYLRQCLLQPGGSFTRFNGMSGIITAMGAYEIMSACDHCSEANWFRVVADVRTCGKTELGIVASLYVFFPDYIVSVNKNSETWVNGRKVSLPVMLKGEISVTISDNVVVIEKRSVLRVSYSTKPLVSVAISTYLTDVCGACGNFTESSPVRTSTSIQPYMNSWEAKDFSNW